MPLKDVTVDEWIAALRSGKYRQTAYRLHRFAQVKAPSYLPKPIEVEVGPDGEPVKHMCCLGVLLDLRGVEWVQDEEVGGDAYTYAIDGEPAMSENGWAPRIGMPAPEDLPEWLTHEVAEQLATINDNSMAARMDAGGNYANVIEEIEWRYRQGLMRSPAQERDEVDA